MATTAAVLGRTDVEIVPYLLIEGIGVIDVATMKQLYIFTRTPIGWSASGKLFKEGLHTPHAFTQAIDPTGGVESPATLDLDVEDIVDYAGDPLLGKLTAVYRSAYFRNDGSGQPTTFLSASLTPGAVTATVDDTSAFDAAGHIWIGNELIQYAGKTATTFTGLTRGKYNPSGGSYGLYHSVRLTSSVADAPPVLPVVSAVPYSILGRKAVVWLTHIERDGTWGAEADAYRWFTGRIRSYAWTGAAWRISVESILADLARSLYAEQPPAVHLRGRWIGGTADDREFKTRPTSPPGVLHDYRSPPIGAGLARYFGSPDFSDALWDINTANAWTYPDWSQAGAYDRELNLAMSFLTFGIDVQLGPAWRGLLDAQAMTSVAESSTETAYALIGQIPAVYFFERPGSTGASVILHVSDGEALARWQVTQGDGDFRPGGPAAITAYGVVQQDQAVAPFGFGSGDISSADPFDPTVTGIPTLIPHLTGQLFEDAPPVWQFRQYAASDEPLLVKQVWIPATYEGERFGTMLLRLLCSTGQTGYQVSGVVSDSIDVYPAGWGLGMDVRDIDEQSFVDLDATVAAAGGYFLAFSRPRPAREVLEEIGKVFGLLFVTKAGKLTARRAPALDLASTSAATLTTSNTAGTEDRTRARVDASGVYNVVRVQYGYNEIADSWPEGGTLTFNDLSSIQIYGLQKKLDIQARGIPVGDDDGRDALLISAVGRQLLMRYANLAVERGGVHTLATLISPGDLVTLTDPSLPDPFVGTRGVTTRTCIVESVTKNLATGRLDLRMRMVPFVRVSPYSPAALVTSYVDATKIITCAANTFSAAGTAADASFFPVGTRVRIVQRDSSTAAPATNYQRTVTAQSGNTITVDVALGAGFPGTDEWFVTFDTYSVWTATMKDTGSAFGDASDHRILTTQDRYLLV